MIKFVIVVFTLFCPVAFPVNHSLQFMFMGSSGVPNIPEFVGVVKVDEAEMVYCDSNVTSPQPKQDWQKIFSDKMPDLIDLYTHCLDRQSFFRQNIHDLMEHHSQTGGVHTFQGMYGCEWDDKTEKVRRFDQFGYDGEDFVTFARKAETWTNVNQRNLDNERIHIKNFLTRACFDWLKKYLDHGKSFLQRTELPSVSLLQKTPSSPVTCLATGFYPDRADLFWRKDGEKLHEDVDKGEILPNHDETFQWSVLLQLSSIKPKDWRRYNCVFQLSGVKDIIIKLDKTVIKTNRDYYICKTLNETDTHITVAVVVFSIFLFAILIFIVCKILKDPSGEQTRQPNNHLKYSSAAALVVAFILVVLNGILVHKNSEGASEDVVLVQDQLDLDSVHNVMLRDVVSDLYISFPSDFMSKWGDSLPGKQLNI